MRGAISEGGGNASLAREGRVPSQQLSGGQGVHREVESEGHEEKYRAVIDGGHPDDEPVGQRWDRSSLHYGGEGVLIHPPHQGVCGWHGTEEQRVTSGGLAGSPENSRSKRPYKRERSGK